MEIVVATVIGACLGGIIRYLVPGRNSYGLALLPSLGGTVTTIFWAIFVWVGLDMGGGWMWTISLTLGVITALLGAIFIPKNRAAKDTRRMGELTSKQA